MRGSSEPLRTEIRELTPLDGEYPERLRLLPDRPGQIYVRGSLPEEDCPSVAIIGARDCSEYGRELAECFGKMLASRGVSVISGMAAGIDAAGHWGALAAGGKSYAVFGNGPDICYPVGNFRLYERLLLGGGGHISEYPPGTPSFRQNFLRRNRIIAGLSDAVLVMEAKERSGTFSTVGHALEQGKPVFALPGRITDRLSEGCNRLIREGAGILTSVEDVLEALHLEREHRQPPRETAPRLSEEQDSVYRQLSETSVHMERLIERSGAAPGRLPSLLLELELLGLCESPKAGYYRRKLAKSF